MVCAWNLDQDGRDVMKPRSGLEDVTKAEPKICVRRVVKRSRYGVMNTGSKRPCLGLVVRLSRSRLAITVKKARNAAKNDD